jgi:hypothetical protein
MAAERKLKLTAATDKAIALKAPAALAASYSLTFPPDDGTLGYQLATDGNGILSWVPPGGSESFAQVKILNQGPLELQDADGSAFVRHRAAAIVTASYTLTWPAAAPGSTQFVQVDSAGVISFAAGASTLQTAYDANPNITLDATGSIFIVQPLADVALRIDKDHVGAGTAFVIVDDGTGGCAAFTQLGDGPGLTVNKTAGAQPVAQFAGSGAISGSILKLTNPAAGSAIGLEIVGAGSSPAASITQSTTAATALLITQNTAARALSVNKTTGSSAASFIDNDGTGPGLQIVQDGAGTGLALDQNGNAVAAILTQTQNQVGLRIFKSGAGAGVALQLEDDGTGGALSIQQDGAGSGFSLTQNGAARAALITQTQNQQGLRVFKSGAGAGEAVQIENDGTGTGLHVLQDGDAVAATFAAAAASGNAVLQLTHLSSNPLPDVRGTSGLWAINNKGTAAFKRASFAESSHTISGGAITISGTLPGGSLVVDTEGAAGTDNLDNILSDSSDPVLAGTIIALRAANSARTVVVRSNAPGNLRMNAGGDRSLDNADDTVFIWFNGTNWLELSFSSNGG